MLGKVSFSKVDFSGLPKSSSTVRCGGDQAGGCPSRQTVGLPFRGSGSNGTESSMQQKPKAGWLSPSRVVYSGIGWGAVLRTKPVSGRVAPIKAVQTSGAASPEQSFMAAAANGWDGWIPAVPARPPAQPVRATRGAVMASAAGPLAPYGQCQNFRVDTPTRRPGRT